MNINIVHLPKTFPYLVDLSLAFYKYGFSSVTLVANGFDYQQFNALKEFVSKYSFLKIVDIPTKRVVSHGEALNYAFKHSNDEFFAFADHDIFPVQPIIDTIYSALNNYDVVCFGDRPENVTTNYKGFAASAVSSQSGIPLATSFFSVYKRSALKDVAAEFSVGFEQYFRKSQIPIKLRNHQDIQALNEPFLIDTCKALSLAMHQSNKITKHVNSEHVCHLGGLCGAINRLNNNLNYDEFIIQDMPSQAELEEYYRAKQIRHPKVLEAKRIISDYSLQLLIALQSGTSKPDIQCKDVNYQQAIDFIKEQTALIYSKP